MKSLEYTSPVIYIWNRLIYKQLVNCSVNWFWFAALVQIQWQRYTHIQLFKSVQADTDWNGGQPFWPIQQAKAYKAN